MADLKPTREGAEGTEARIISGGGADHRKGVGIEDPSSGESPVITAIVPDTSGSFTNVASSAGLDDVVVVPRSIDDGNPDFSSKSYVEGGAGYDTLILPGSPNDYYFSLSQNPTDYPNILNDSWNSPDGGLQESQLGNVIVINHVNGDQIIAQGVESFRFDPNGVVDSPRDLADGRLVEISDDNTVTTEEAFAHAVNHASPEEMNTSIIAASRHAAEELKSQGHQYSANSSNIMYSLLPENAEAAEMATQEFLQSLDPDKINSEALYERGTSSDPVSPKTLEAMGISASAAVPQTLEAAGTTAIPPVAAPTP